jgi:hypothetical protein
VATRSVDRLWIVDPRTNQSRQYAIPGHLERSTLGIYLVGDEILLTDIDRSYRTKTASLVWLDRGGRVLRERTVAVRAPQSPGQPGEWAAAAMVPVPTILALAAFVAYPLEQLDSGATATYGEGLVAACRRFREAIVVVSLAATALAAWCFRRHKRYAQSGAWVWCVFVLLLGVPGLIGYLLHRRWPVFETCSACGRRGVGDRETCQACGAAFPAPPPIGTEVFA